MACAAMAFFLAACGGADETGGGNGDPAQNGGQGTAAQNGSNGQPEETMTEAAIEEQYARGQYTLTEDGAADDQYEDAAPEDLPFPLPPEADIIVSGQTDERAYAVAMNVPSGQEAYEFYLESLPDAGFEIIRDSAANRSGQNGEDEPFSAVLVVEGNDLRGLMRFDEERAIIGMSAAEFEAAERRRQEFQEEMESFEEEGRQAPEQPPEGQTPEEAPPEEAPPEGQAPEEAPPE